MSKLFPLSPHLVLFGIVLSVSSCASRPIASFEHGRPLFDPLEFFAGNTHSSGVVETPSGSPRQLLSTTTVGHLEGGRLHFEQDLTIDGKKSHRSWIIRRLDQHRYTATGTGIVGMARAEARGNVLHLQFTIEALPGNPLGDLHMSQWMYLQPGGLTMVNRGTLTKGGIVVAMVTEQFRKER